MKKITSIALNALLFLHCLLLFLIVFESSVKIPFWLQPVGRMHPILLHFPVAFIALLVLLNLLKGQLDKDTFKKINLFLLLITALSTVLATIMGFVLSLEGYESDVMRLHKWGGIILSFILYGLVVLREKTRLYQALLYVGLLGVVVVGHYGAGLTHGTGFITEPLLVAKKAEVNDNTPIYAAYIKPILDSKCTSCHNDQKQKGELNLSSIKGIAKGGKNGALWVAHQPERSLFMQRVHLPIEEKEHMPPEGKPQLTPNEIELLEAWILHGTNDTISFAELKENAPLKALVGEKWQKSNSSKIPQYDFDFADKTVLESLNSPYRTVIQKSPKSPAIDVSIYGESTYSLEHLTELSKIKEQLVFLNVSKLPIDSKAMAFIGTLTSLEQVILNGTGIESTDLKALEACVNLKSISLSSTNVDASVLNSLKQLKNLKEVFIWNTSITAEEVEDFKKALPSVKFFEGYVSDANTLVSLTPPILKGRVNVINSGDKVKIWHKMDGVQIRYTENGDVPDETSKLLESDLVIDLEGQRTKTIKAIAYKEGWKPSKVRNFTFQDKGYLPESFELEYEGILHEYTGSAKRILLDDVVMNNSGVYVSKFWSAFIEQPLIATADFGDETTTELKEIIISMGYSFYQSRANQCSVDYVELWTSNDKDDWKLVQKRSYKNTKNLNDIRNIVLKVPKGKHRYYKVVAQPSGIKMHVDQIFFY
ncbi:c-type cytochrome domain-containing protein [Seonamhaeicola marinus]|uniref:Uncharacterized protein n=1 Tax=Seonamhaeicola marinus TaxID=1912246 RepID=A0A5D0IA32_9FLAO|nr:c-type cytochrome domain-containing protein [Seonamhaeicola marinus]TYA78622.1 hypothetical protein FUA24_09730 [Seonamhaeicola marinus]